MALKYGLCGPEPSAASVGLLLAPPGHTYHPDNQTKPLECVNIAKLKFHQWKG